MEIVHKSIFNRHVSRTLPPILILNTLHHIPLMFLTCTSVEEFCIFITRLQPAFLCSLFPFYILLFEEILQIIFKLILLLNIKFIFLHLNELKFPLFFHNLVFHFPPFLPNPFLESTLTTIQIISNFSPSQFRSVPDPPDLLYQLGIFTVFLPACLISKLPPLPPRQFIILGEKN
jgi:hypothetical protein